MMYHFRSTTGAVTRWRLPARGVLALLSFLGFFTNYMLRVNINIAIVQMVRSPQAAHSNDTAPAQQMEGEFDWSVHEQGLVLGSYYWCYVLTLLPANMLTQRLGTKLVFGAANLLSSLGALLSPLAARHHYTALVVVRVLQGLSSGPTWPAMHVIVSRWIPPHERSKFVSTYYGASVGAATAFLLCGVLIDKLSWEYAFYVPGALGIMWCIMWWLLVFDSPVNHPRISRTEREMIEHEMEPHLARIQPPVPLMDILVCLPFWALIVGNVGGTWSFLFFLTYGATYFKNMHSIGIEMNGLISGLCNLTRFIVAVLFSWLADHLLKSRRWTTTSARKLATATALLPSGVMCLLLTHTDCSSADEVFIFIVVMGLGGCASSGTLANSLDLAPNFAGVTLSMVSLVSVSSGFLIPPMVSAIIGEQLSSLEQWRVVFGITAVISIFSCLVFLLFGSGEVQRWNEPREAQSNHTEDLLLEQWPQPAFPISQDYNQ